MKKGKDKKKFLDNKKMILLMVLFLVIILVIGLVFIHFINDDDTGEENNELVGYTYRVGYLGEISNYDRKIVLSDYDYFEYYFVKNTNNTYDGNGNIVSSSTDEILSRYDKEYFKDKSLAVLYVELSSGSITIEYQNAIVNGNKIKINYKSISPEIGTMDMSGYFVIVEVPKNITEIDNN